MDYKENDLTEYDAEYTIRDLLEMDNIADVLDDETQRRIGSDGIDGYQADKSSRSHREDRMKEAMDLAMQVVTPKSYPFDGCANVLLPIITTASNQFAARAYPAIIDDAAVAKPKIIGNDDGVEQPVLDPQGQPVIDPETGQPAMQVVGKDAKREMGDAWCDLLNWQLLEQIENWEEDTDRLVHILPVTGNVYRKMYWNGEKPEAGLITPDNFIVDYYTTSLKKCPRITQEYKLYPYEIEEKIRSGLYVEFGYGMADGDAKELSPDTHDDGSESLGKHSPHLFIEQHTRIDLDGDGYPEPYIAMIHVATRKLVRLVANYNADSIKTKLVGKKEEITSIKPDEYFVKYGFIPSPDGSFYDLGFGELLYHLNVSSNSIVNRLLDAGTLASTSSGFLAKGIKMKTGALRVKAGEFPVIDTRGRPLRDAFVQIQHPQPSPVLYELLNMLIGMAEKLAGVQNINPAEVNSQMAGVTMMQLVEQGLTGFKSIYKRIERGIKQELRILTRLNKLYLPDRVYAAVVGSPDAVMDRDIALQGFEVIPVADPSMLTDQQKLGAAQALTAWKDDPYMNGMEIRERIFNAMGIDTRNLIQQPSAPPPDAGMALVEVEAEKARNKAAEAQLKGQLDAARLELEAIKSKKKSEQDQIKLDAEVNEMESRTIKNLADAEAAEEGKQFEQYKQQKEQLSEPERLQGMEGATLNGQVS